MNKKNDESRQLEALEQWRAAELQNARIEHAELARIKDDKQIVLNDAEAGLAETHLLARERMSRAEILSVDALHRISLFGEAQVRDVDAARQALQESAAASEAARVNVVRHHESLTVVEKLRERRLNEASKEVLRLEQKRLDEQALSRLAANLNSKA